MKSQIKTIIEDNQDKYGKIFDLIIQSLVVVSLISFSLETLPNLSREQIAILNLVESVIVYIFTIEYFLRCWVAKKARNYIFSFFGVIDLLAILPFYLALAVDLRGLRAIRLLRIFQILKFFRFGDASQRFVKAMKLALPELIIFFSVALVMMYLAAMGIYFFENSAQPENFPSVIHSLWWATTTLTTVGYGDVYPITIGGKLFTFFILMLGLGVVGVPTAIIASALSTIRRNDN